MPKHINISINGPVGEFEDEWGYTCYGFMANYIDWMVGFNYEDGSIGYSDLEQVTFRINSDGGSVTEGFEILSKMEMLKEKSIKVEVINDSRAYSIASLLMQGASKGMRKSRSYALFMAHKPWAQCTGNADEMRKYADYLDKYEMPMIRVYMAASGKTEEELQALLREERFMTAEEAKAEGFIDEVLPINIEGAAPAQAEKKAVASYNPKSNQVQSNNMAITKEEKEGIVASVIEGVKSLFTKDADKNKPTATAKPKPAASTKPKPKPKAQEVTEPVAASTETSDGADIFYEGELEQGTEVFADAEYTEALEDGLYDLADGREIEVVDGAVANITEAEEEEEEETEASASAKKPTPKAKADQVDNALEKEVKALQAKLETLSKQVPGSGNAGPKGAQEFTDKNKGKAHPLDSVAAKIRK
ncbi:Clp protease ClpP [Pontibacter rugosus]|uniref:ATP-dependent Clp protease proteolytic subunit n=1 Tax=Pontibacter rugosus TaxID=1745966 RepID=A0ABW3SJB1_9BACT